MAAASPSPSELSRAQAAKVEAPTAMSHTPSSMIFATPATGTPRSLLPAAFSVCEASQLGSNTSIATVEEGFANQSSPDKPPAKHTMTAARNPAKLPHIWLLFQ